MFRALFDIWDGAFSRGIIGFKVWSVFCEECSEVCSEPTGATEVELFADASLGSMSHTAGGGKISTTAINSIT